MLIGLVAGSVVLAGMLPATAAARGSCSPAGSRAVFANRTVRVYRSGSRYFGCLYRVRRAVRLRAPAPSTPGARPPRFQTFRTAGNFLAYVYNDYAVDSTGDDWTLYIESFDLRRGRLAHQATASRTPGCFADPVPPNVSSLVLKSNGAIGWIQHSCTPDAALAADRAGTRPLGDADARSMRLHRSTLSWTNGGIPESATLA
ncbi:MAG: hypothetical protein QOJ55_1543 [Solirubrobacteraceae bacterium]|nr:hypothetical protein [Solirubrobacteraceae bacterium]